jgi:hypothetical protein
MRKCDGLKEYEKHYGDFGSRVKKLRSTRSVRRSVKYVSEGENL